MLNDKQFEVLSDMDDWWIVRGKLDTLWEQEYYTYHVPCSFICGRNQGFCGVCKEGTPQDVSIVYTLISRRIL